MYFPRGKDMNWVKSEVEYYGLNMSPQNSCTLTPKVFGGGAFGRGSRFRQSDEWGGATMMGLMSL